VDFSCLALKLLVRGGGTGLARPLTVIMAGWAGPTPCDTGSLSNSDNLALPVTSVSGTNLGGFSKLRICCCCCCCCIATTG
jgi:hypothetical protein